MVIFALRPGRLGDDEEEPLGVNEAATSKRFGFDFLKRFNFDRLSNPDIFI